MSNSCGHAEVGSYAEKSRTFLTEYEAKFSAQGKNINTHIKKIDAWQGGDIVVFKRHIGIVSDKRNHKGISFVIHHANPYQKYYEEDILEQHNDITGHYRIS